jgi:hypothetical protein
MISRVLIILFFSIAFYSCTVTQQTKTLKTAKYMEISQPGVYAIPVVADLKVSEEKITGNSAGRIIPDAVDRYTVVEGLKVEAVSNAIKNSKADVLVEPDFTVEVVGYDVKVAVTGYPAVYKNFRNYSASDSMALKMSYLNRVQKTTGGDVKQVQEKRKPKLGYFAAGCAVFLAVILATGGGG